MFIQNPRRCPFANITSYQSSTFPIALHRALSITHRRGAAHCFYMKSARIASQACMDVLRPQALLLIPKSRRRAFNVRVVCSNTALTLIFQKH